MSIEQAEPTNDTDRIVSAAELEAYKQAIHQSGVLLTSNTTMLELLERKFGARFRHEPLRDPGGVSAHSGRGASGDPYVGPAVRDPVDALNRSRTGRHEASQ